MAISKKVSIFWCGEVMIGGHWRTVPELLIDRDEPGLKANLFR
jgi:hypothetical protein